MNALGITGIKNNVRVLLLNNTGGAEFHYNVGTSIFPSLDNYISAKHNKTAEGWARSLGYRYFSATNMKEVEDLMHLFIDDSSAPILFEVFTKMDTDAEIIKNELGKNISKRTAKSKLKGVLKAIIRK